MSASNEDGKLDWMYKNSNEIVDREEYLLGRKLDKNLDSQSCFSANESIPSSIFSLPETTNKIDALRKLKEDPLEAIREKEREMRKELLKNPIQMKKLQKMVEAQKSKFKEKEEKKKTKNKKKKSKGDKLDDVELDNVLSKKLATLLKKYGRDGIFNSDEVQKNSEKSKCNDSSSQSSEDSDSSYSDSSEQSSKRVGKKSNKNKSTESKSRSGYGRSQNISDRRSKGKKPDSCSDSSDDARSSKRVGRENSVRFRDKQSEKYTRKDTSGSRYDTKVSKHFESHGGNQKRREHNYKKEKEKSKYCSDSDELDNLLASKFKKLIEQYGEDEVVKCSEDLKKNKETKANKSKNVSSSDRESSSDETGPNFEKSSKSTNNLQRQRSRSDDNERSSAKGTQKYHNKAKDVDGQSSNYSKNYFTQSTRNRKLPKHNELRGIQKKEGHDSRKNKSKYAEDGHSSDNSSDDSVHEGNKKKSSKDTKREEGRKRVYGIKQNTGKILSQSSSSSDPSDSGSDRRASKKFKRYDPSGVRKGRDRSPTREAKPFGLYVPEGARKAGESGSKKERDSSKRSKDSSSGRKSMERDECGKSSRSDNVRGSRRSPTRERNYKRKQDLSREEKEKKLKEMMENVSWRNDIMEQNSKRHKEESKKEQEKQQEYDENFTRNQMSKGIYAESVEKRIKSKMHNIQRSSFAMDKHFTKR